MADAPVRASQSAAAVFAKPDSRASGRSEAARWRLVEQITACWRTQALAVAVELDLPDRLVGGSHSVDELARETGCDADALQRILRALCVLQVCRERRDGRFGLGAAGTWLLRESDCGGPGLRAMVLWWAGPLWALWPELGYSVRTGRSARERLTGRRGYGFLDEGGETSRRFHGAMRALTATVAADVARLPFWKEARWMVDVGGGEGELAATVAQAHPALRGTVVDREDAAPGAQALLATRGLGRRVRFAVGDFFTWVPGGADWYLLKSILHNWDGAAAARILARCAAAAPEGGGLLVIERLRPERLRAGSRDDAVARADLNMLMGLGGRERSLLEYERLLSAAGFRLVSCEPLGHEFAAIKATRMNDADQVRSRETA